MAFWLVALAVLNFISVADVQLPGAPTRFDYQCIDPQKQLLFIAHLGDGNVVVFDTKKKRVTATIQKIKDVHGVLAVPDEDVVFATATGTDEVVAIGERTLKVLWRTPGGDYPDGLAYDPITRRLFVSDEHGKTETVIDTKSHRPIATIALGGEAGNTQYDPITRHMFVNVQTLEQLAEIDPRRDVVVRRYPVGGSGCKGNHGLLIDARWRRAFVACEDTATFLWIDMRDMRIVQSWSIGEEPDVVALDNQSGRVFVAGESGVVSVFSDRERVMRLAQGYLAASAHTVAVDSRTQLVYFPLENVAGKPVLRILKEWP